jgi:NAD-dependent DNA ligase
MTLSEIDELLIDGNYLGAIKILNDLYRQGTPLVTDAEYDSILEDFKKIDPKNELFTSGVIESVEVNSARKEKLKYPMFSLDKETEISAIHKWLKNKGLPLTTLLVITSKYDGISILKDEYNQLAWSRGDGVIGETVHTHYKMLADKYKKIDLFTIGEMIIPKPIFASKTYYRDNGEPFKNARNMIAGLKNSDTISEDLKDAKHIRYGFASEDFTLNKSEQIDLICEKLSPIPYKVIKANELNIDMLNDLFLEWGKEYDIDGLVFDIDDKNIRKNLGRERNNNPAYARAFKNPEWAEAKETTIIEIVKEVSKQGYLKPVGLVNPINLDGVTVSRVTLNNYKFVKDNELGVGSIVKILRSGMVIPKIVSIIKATGFEMPTFGDSNIFWNETGVELVVEGTEEQEIKKLISFFEILGAENVSEGIINQLYNSGYKTIEKILDLTTVDLEKIDRFGERKSQIVYDSMHKSVTNVKLSKLMHATSIFKNLGSKKLELLMHFDGKPTFDEIIKVDGFSDISAKAYLDGYDEFYKWLSGMTKITIETKKEKNIMEKNDLENVSFCFTGIRRKDLEELIESRSGKILSGVSKNLTFLVMKDKNSSSSKAVKAQELGVKLLSVEDLEDFLNL